MGIPMSRQGKDNFKTQLRKLGVNKLINLNLQPGTFTEEQTRELIDALPYAKDLRFADLSGTHFQKSVEVELCNTVGQLPGLILVDIMNTGIGEEGRNALVESLLSTPNPILLKVLTSPDMRHQTTLGGILEANMAACMRAKDTIIKWKNQLPSLEEITIPELALVESRLPAIKHNRSPVHNFGDAGQYARILGLLPSISAYADDDDIEKLFAADGNFTPLDNPLTWRANPTLLCKLAEDGKLTDEILEQRTPMGATLIDYALCFGSFPETLATIDALGIDLRKHLLPTPDKKPSIALQGICERGMARQIFTKERWIGGGASELRAVLRSLPEHITIPNGHTLVAAVSKSKLYPAAVSAPSQDSSRSI